MNGKILRIDSGTGAGLASNPYFNGNPSAIKSKIWVTGLRNPFRFALKPGAFTGVIPPLFIGDVGWNAYEEIDVALGGENFGWPCKEGSAATPEFPGMDPASFGCDTIGTPSNPGPVKNPLIKWHQDDPGLSTPPGFTGKTVIGGVFYTGTKYPAAYQGGYFFGDFIAGWMKVMKVNSSNQLVSLTDFAGAGSGPVGFAVHPGNGDICYISFFEKKVFRIRYPGTTAMVADGAGNDAAAEAVEVSDGACAGDVAPVQAGDGVVDLDDLLMALDEWEDGDGETEFSAVMDDVLAVISAWGPCE
jgi:glucose/arabinose dehydrogenase